MNQIQETKNKLDLNTIHIDKYISLGVPLSMIKTLLTENDLYYIKIYDEYFFDDFEFKYNHILHLLI